MNNEMKPMTWWAEIQRVLESSRQVEAYAFVNEVVEGEGGLRLRRAAMESATEEYMRWANVRRMHQADAVGVVESLTWDDHGAKLRLRIVDEDAWAKVQAGVYKGLSVGVIPTVMQGTDVLACRWIETSLVDRPKDPDARIVAFRAPVPSLDVLAELETSLSEALARIEQLEAMPARPRPLRTATEPDSDAATVTRADLSDPERFRAALHHARTKRTNSDLTL